MATGTFYDPARKILHDRSFAKRVAVCDGRLPPTGNIAILAIFQPAGVAASTLFALEHLAASGHTPIVVSNAPVDRSDSAALRDRSTLLAIRPDTGRDFGAYRDGIRLMTRLGLKAGRLVLMNDSTWFPLREGDDSIDRMAAMDCDMSGHVFKTESATSRARDHVESHFLMFGPGALNSPAFQFFWRRYLMSDTRELTIRRGELGITQAMLAAGHAVSALLGRASFLQILEDLDDRQLLGVLRDVVHHREDARLLCAELERRATAGGAWREAFRDWVDTSLLSSRQHLLSATFIAPAIRLGGLGFVKKATDPRFHFAREKVLQMEAEGRIPPLHSDVRSEMSDLVSRFADTPRP